MTKIYGASDDLIEFEGDFRGIDDIDDRKLLRDDLSTLLCNQFGEYPQVYFDDECPDCGNILIDKKCNQKYCISYDNYEN